MAGLPGWVRQEKAWNEDNKLVVQFRMRRWHPSYWRMMWCLLAAVAEEEGIPRWRLIPMYLRGVVKVAIADAARDISRLRR